MKANCKKRTWPRSFDVTWLTCRRKSHLAGLPREQIFTHCGGWAEGELLYAAALNDYSCPGWSFYRHGRDPRGDKTAMAAIAASNAPYWAAVEWLPIGAKTADDWRDCDSQHAHHRSLPLSCASTIGEQIRHDVIAQEGIRRALAEPAADCKSVTAAIKTASPWRETTSVANRPATATAEFWGSANPATGRWSTRRHCA